MKTITNVVLYPRSTEHDPTTTMQITHGPFLLVERGMIGVKKWQNIGKLL
jgi:hypothetical protein